MNELQNSWKFLRLGEHMMVGNKASMSWSSTHSNTLKENIKQQYTWRMTMEDLLMLEACDDSLIRCKKPYHNGFFLDNNCVYFLYSSSGYRV